MPLVKKLTMKKLTMKTLILYSILLLFLIPVIMGYALEDDNKREEMAYPTISFEYSYVPFDKVCSKYNGFKIEQEWIDEMNQTIDSFDAIWQKQGTPLLEMTVKDIGKPFLQKDMVAILSLCNYPSMSHPLIVNMRKYMSSATNGKPRPKHLFKALIFHELLHTYVDDIIKECQTTPLLEKYKDEAGSVLSHIHLMAVMKHVYIKSGLLKELEDVIAKDRSIGSVYERAWEIVNDLENYQDLIEELKSNCK